MRIQFPFFHFFLNFSNDSLFPLRKAEQCAEGCGKAIEGIELTGHGYLQQELGKFRQAKTERPDKDKAASTIGSGGSGSSEDEGAHQVLKDTPDYAKMGYDPKMATEYKTGLLSTYRKKKEQTPREESGVEKTQHEAEAAQEELPPPPPPAEKTAPAPPEQTTAE